MCGEIAPDDFMVIVTGSSKLFSMVICLVDFELEVIAPKFNFPSVRSKPVFSARTNFDGMVVLSKGALERVRIINVVSVRIIMLPVIIFLFLFLAIFFT